MIVVPPVSPQASPAAQELGQKIAAVIRDYQQSHPGLPSADVHQALRIARLSSGVGPNLKLFIALAVGLLVFGGFLAFSMSSRSSGDGMSFPMMHVLVALFLLAVLGIIVVAKR